MKPNVITYHSVNPDALTPWVAYIVLENGEYWGVRFSEHTEEAVIDAALNRWKIEKAKGERLSPSAPVTPTAKLPAMRTKPSTNLSTTPSPEATGLAGKVWMLNRTSGHRARINASELDSYLSQGYVKGGPRSK
jgi:hypothetical protein